MASLPEEVLRIDPEQREAVRHAILELLHERGRYGVDRVLAQIKGRGNVRIAIRKVSTLVRLCKAQQLDPSTPWLEHGQRRNGGGSEEAGDLAEAILDARNHQQLQAIAQRLTALTLSGEVEPKHAQAAQRLLHEARLNLTQELKRAGEQAEAAVLVLQETAELARAYEGIVDGRRRAAVRVLCQRLAELDAERYPVGEGADPRTITERLAEDGLDAWGESVDQVESVLRESDLGEWDPA